MVLESAARLTTPAGRVMMIHNRLIFGRGPDVDLTVEAGRGLSRRAGLITALADGGVLVANISLTHALYVQFGGDRIRLPRLEARGEPRGGWYVREGEALIGSGPMIDEGTALRLSVDPPELGPYETRTGPEEERTLLPLYLDPGTKLYLVALLWCRPWLLDPSRTTALPRTPEIARAALEVTGARSELERFETDPAFRDRLATRVGEHLRALRRKILERGLVKAGGRLSDEVVVAILVENGIIAPGDLARLSDPVWLSR
ncbi:MAG: hypothetical protein ABIS86_01470, partial [Streptosporangiaceae bacterium]